jgi:hypothetical protein
MENIIEPNDFFDFSKLSLTHPISIQGGAYFTKIQYNEKPLYIQTTKSLTRQGFIKTGKKYYCDLMFDQTSIPLIHWFENLEERSQQLIYEKSDTWFQNALEKSDVESAFNSIIRIFKSGKYYLVRTNVKTSLVNNEPVVKIYDENELPFSFQEVTNETNVISILEIQGIKFTSRNFQIEIELKQMMVILDNEPIFDNCVIKTSTSHKKEFKKNENLVSEENLGKTSMILEDSSSFLSNHDMIERPLEKVEQQEEQDPIVENKESKVTDFISRNDDEEESSNHDNETTYEPLDLVIEELDVELPTTEDMIQEIDIKSSLEENPLEAMTLKKPNQVYFELYKEARTKAKEAKKNLVLAYLEAKNIKKTYMLDDFENHDSDSDLDAEIDEISESELEDL